MTIDVHVHTFPDHLAARALLALAEKTKPHVDPVADGTVTGLLDAMRKSGIDHAVVCPIATKPSHFEGILQEALAIRDGARGEEAAHRLIPFASVHPDDEARFDHLKRTAESGIKGIKLHPYYQPCVLDTPGMLEFFRCCRDLNLIVQCHCGFDIGFADDSICSPERIARVMDEIPGLPFIAAHLGGWQCWQDVAKHLLGKPIYLDTAVLPMVFDNHTLQRILEEHPQDKLLFATDWPWLNFEDGIRFIRQADLGAEKTDAILGGNAAHLLGLY